MADQNSPIKKDNFTVRQRFDLQDAEGISENALDNLSVNNFASMSNHGCVSSGFHIEHSSGRVFNIGKGAAFKEGELIKGTVGKSVTLNVNGNANPRIDLVELTGYTFVDTESQTRKIISAVSLQNEAAFAMGTGDGNSKSFDLGHKEVDLRYLNIYIGTVSDANIVYNWVFKKGSGAGGLDQVIVKDTLSGTPYVASYKYRSGGVESNQSVDVLKRMEPVFAVVQGTPSASPSAPSVSSQENVAIGEIKVPGSWTSGSSGVEISYNERTPLVHFDTTTDSEPNNVPDFQGGRIDAALRFIDKIKSGMSLRFGGTNVLKITPGWAVYRGVSMYTDEEVSFTISSATQGWNYCYIRPKVLSLTNKSGSPPDLVLTTNPPNNTTRENGTTPGIFVGSVYVCSTVPVKIRPFHRHGNLVRYIGVYDNTDRDRIFKDGALAAANVSSPTEVGADVDLTEAIPSTGSMSYLKLLVKSEVPTGFTSTERCLGTARVLPSSGDQFTLAHNQALSLVANNLTFFPPSLFDMGLQASVSHEPETSFGNYATAYGFIRSEGRVFRTRVEKLEDDHETSCKVTVLGYIEDVSSMSSTGGSEGLF